MEDKEKRLTPILVRRIGQSLSGTNRSRQDVRPRPFNPNDEHSRTHMGSTTFGNVDRTSVGLALPQDIKINRAGYGRVRVMVCA